MANQVAQRLNLASQAAEACRDYLDALHRLQNLAERRPFLGNFADADFAGTALAYLDAGTAGVLFDFVVPALLAGYADAANGGRNKQVLNQVAPNL